MEQLEIEGFVSLPGIVEPAGVYCLISNGEVVYVGKSKSILGRIAQHRARRNGKVEKRATKIRVTTGDMSGASISFDKVWVLFCAERDLERLELEYIDRFKPKWNIQIRQPLPKHKIDIHALAEQMKWSLRNDIPRRKGL